VRQRRGVFLIAAPAPRRFRKFDARARASFAVSTSRRAARCRLFVNMRSPSGSLALRRATLRYVRRVCCRALGRELRLSSNTESRRQALWHVLAAGTSALGLVACTGVRKPRAGSAPYPLSKAGPAPGASAQAQALAASLGRGINFGNMLEAPREGDWGLRVEDAFIDLVAQPGFADSVRLPVRWSNHASADAEAIIDARFFDRVDGIVERLLARRLTVVLNMHHYRQLEGKPLDRHETAVAPGVVEQRFYAMWRQIAARYARHDPRLLFEPYNEPNGAMNATWNDQLSRVVRVIRESNPQRVLVVGPGHWNNADALAQLVLPPDPHLILTIHQYEPFDFTHQGAEWVAPPQPTGVDCCDAGQQQTIIAKLDLAEREARRLGYPVYVGEFGALSKAPQAARIRFLRFMREQMAQRRMSWSYWELASGFGLYDPVAKALRADMFDALFGR
jgi:endoglucanase